MGFLLWSCFNRSVMGSSSDKRQVLPASSTLAIFSAAAATAAAAAVSGMRSDPSNQRSVSSARSANSASHSARAEASAFFHLCRLSRQLDPGEMGLMGRPLGSFFGVRPHFFASL